MDQLLVSIIVPVYGVEKYLDDCVASLVDQTYRNLEIILVDDGSPDRCGAMCDAWAEKDGRIVSLHKENGGQGTARNLALDLCKGDYVLFVDSDDVIDHNMVESMVYATNDGEYDLVLCGIKFNNGIRKISGKWYSESFLTDNREAIRRYVQDGKIFTGPMCKLFSRSVFANIRFPAFRANEDAYIMHRLIGECKNVYFLNLFLYTMNLRSDSTEGKCFNPHKLHLIDCAKDLKKFINENYPEYSVFVESRVLNGTMVLINRLYIDRLERQYPDIEKKLSAILKAEYTYLKQIDCSEYDKNVDLYLNNPFLYRIKMNITIVIRYLKRKVKNLIVALKSR